MTSSSSSWFLQLAVAWLILMTPSHAAICKDAGVVCTRHRRKLPGSNGEPKRWTRTEPRITSFDQSSHTLPSCRVECCGMLMCSPEGTCKSPGAYAEKWLKATTSRRQSYYTKNNVNVALAPVKWSYTLAAAAKNWTDALLQIDDCKDLTDPDEIKSCYSFQNGFVTHCKLIHEGEFNPNTYGE